VHEQLGFASIALRSFSLSLSLAFCFSLPLRHVHRCESACERVIRMNFQVRYDCRCSREKKIEQYFHCMIWWWSCMSSFVLCVWHWLMLTVYMNNRVRVDIEDKEKQTFSIDLDEMTWFIFMYIIYCLYWRTAHTNNDKDLQWFYLIYFFLFIHFSFVKKWEISKRTSRPRQHETTSLVYLFSITIRCKNVFGMIIERIILTWYIVDVTIDLSR
jgi:hypothetical protein